MFLFPGQQIPRTGRRRLLGKSHEEYEKDLARIRAAPDKPSKVPALTRDKFPYGPFWQILDKGHVYSYPTKDPEGANASTRTAYFGMLGFVLLSLGITSYSVRDLLIVLGLAFGEAELYQSNLNRGSWPFWQLYGIGFGMSGVNGWLGGYLVSRFLFKDWNWLSIGGAFTVGSYIYQWYSGLVVGHECHFTTLAEGFIAGVALQYKPIARFLPKPSPIKILARHSGKGTAGIIGTTYLLSYYMKKNMADPEGFVSSVAPREKEKPYDQEDYFGWLSDR